MRLGVIGHVPHWISSDGELLAYEPYVREMQIWADLFGEIHLCSPIANGAVRGNVAPFQRSNVQLHAVSYSSAPGYWGAIRRLSQLPRVAWAAWQTIQQNDFIHLRSPGHFGLAGAVLVRLLRRKSITKWAGNNRVFRGQPFATRCELKLQSRPSQRNPVLVYGPARRSHQISFIPALMSNRELEEARRLSAHKAWKPPWQVLSVGRLSPEKNFPLVLEALALLERRLSRLAWRFTLVGDGPERRNLEHLIAKYGMGEQVVLTGALAFHAAQERFASAHLVVQPNPNEGWPKVIAEAWAHGAIPVAARGGIVPDILRDPNSGVVFEPTPEALASALAELLNHPDRMQAMAQGIHRYAAELSLERFKTRLEQVLVERCGLK